MPESVGYPENLKVKKGPQQPSQTSDAEKDILKFCMASIKLWASATQIARLKFKRDYEYAEGNGKQWANADRIKVQRERRPALEFNQILPQVETACGMQRSDNSIYTAVPRGVEDKRLGEIVSQALRASQDYMRMPRRNAHVFDDGTICGLGVWRILHSIEDAKDVLWGDITAARINPLSFIWDPWASADEGFQDGAFMGDASWMRIDEFRDKYPGRLDMANPGEWMIQAGNYFGDSALLGVGDSLKQELYDQENGMVRVVTMWYKKPASVTLLVNTLSGQVTEFPSKDAANEHLAQMAFQMGKESIQGYQVIQQGTISSLVNTMTGQQEDYAAPELAERRLNELSQAGGMDVYSNMRVITRQARVPHWAELVWGQLLEYGPSPYNDHKYPYVPYVSRMLQDDPESIMGIVRNLWDPQDEYNKRYSNLLAHSNSSAHSGWLNKKSGGANPRDLERMGSVPGVVVEFSAVPPAQIRPVEMSQGHFTMIEHSGQQIMRISGINAEMVGATTQKTVSGRAIRARQQGGAVILEPRMFSFDESKLDVAQMTLSRIQQYYPPAKLKRIIGLFEAATPGQPMSPSVFMDPVTGQPMSEDQIFETLTNLKNIQFDLALKQNNGDATARQEAFERAVQLTTLFAQTGRVIGPNTLAALVEMSDMPSRLEAGFKADAMMPPVMPPQAGGQGDPGQSILNAINQKKGGHKSDSGGPGPEGLAQE